MRERSEKAKATEAAAESAGAQPPRGITAVFAEAIREAIPEAAVSAPSPATATSRGKAKKGGRRNTTRGGGKP